MYFLILLLAILAICAIVIYLRSRAADQPLLVNTRPPAEPVIPVHPLVDPPSNPIIEPIDNPQLPINQIRQSLGNPPRKFSKALRDYLHLNPPGWMATRQRERRSIHRAQEQIRSLGRIVWCAIVDANNRLYSPGADDHGVSVIWSEDRFFDDHVDELERIAGDCQKLKGFDQVEPDAQRFAQVITNPMIHAPRLPVPKSLAGGRDVYHSILTIARKHLPEGYLTQRIMPIWIDSKSSGVVILVPAAYWPPSLLAAWKTSSG